jgi:hypothetical protein
MKPIVTFLVCCVIIAAAKATIAVMTIAALLMLLWGAIFRPAPTFGFLGACLIVMLFDRYPGWSLSLLAVTAMGAKLVDRNISQVDTPTDPI